MSELGKAEVVNVEEVEFEERWNPNKTQQIVELIQIPNSINLDKVSDKKKSKLSKETVESILKMYQEVSVQYGFEMKWNIENIQQNFNDIISDDQEKIFRVLLSKSFGKFQLIFYQRAMINIMTIMEQVSSPEVINDMSVNVEYKYGMMRSLLELMNEVSTMYDKVKVDNPDLVLRNIAQKSQVKDLESIQSDPTTLDVMNQLRKIALHVKEDQDEH
jgi:hypothetical protein